MSNQAVTTIDLNVSQVKQLSSCEAALLLYKKQKAQALRILLSLSRDGDSLVRIRAAECLMEIGDERAIIGLMDMIEDPNPQVRITAIGALGALRAHVAMEKILRALQEDAEISVRIVAARTLGKLGNRKGLTLIVKLLSDDNDFFRRLAVMALRDVIGQSFPPTQEGIKSAKRYLELTMNKYLNGG